VEDKGESPVEMKTGAPLCLKAAQYKEGESPREEEEEKTATSGLKERKRSRHESTSCPPLEHQLFVY
jgi:hypothetical protein